MSGTSDCLTIISDVLDRPKNAAIINIFQTFRIPNMDKDRPTIEFNKKEILTVISIFFLPTVSAINPITGAISVPPNLKAP